MMDGDQPGTTSFSTSSPEVSSSGLGGFLPIAIGLAGVLLGGIALYMSFSGSGKVGQTETSVASLQTQVKGLEDKVRELESALERATNQRNALESYVRSISTQTQNVLNQIGSEMSNTRRLVSTNTDAIAKLTETLNEMRSAPAAATASRNTSTEGGEKTVGAGQQIHTIASGDTFTILARRYGVSIDAIMAANPDADPRRLRVGQQIIIPAPQ